MAKEHLLVCTVEPWDLRQHPKTIYAPLKCVCVFYTLTLCDNTLQFEPPSVF